MKMVNTTWVVQGINLLISDIFGIFDKTEFDMGIYHIIKNGKPLEVSSEELQIMNESTDTIELDIQWYLSNGGITHDDFKKTHLMNGNNIQQ